MYLLVNNIRCSPFLSLIVLKTCVLVFVWRFNSFLPSSLPPYTPTPVPGLTSDSQRPACLCLASTAWPSLKNSLHVVDKSSFICIMYIIYAWHTHIIDILPSPLFSTSLMVFVVHKFLIWGVRVRGQGLLYLRLALTLLCSDFLSLPSEYWDYMFVSLHPDYLVLEIMCRVPCVLGKQSRPHL